jgi:hypothetical protein
MSWRTRINLVVVWIVSLIAVAAWGRAQTPPEQKLPTPIMISGNDLAYRLDGLRGTTPQGRLLMRIDGRWVTVPLRY